MAATGITAPTASDSPVLPGDLGTKLGCPLRNARDDAQEDSSQVRQAQAVRHAQLGGSRLPMLRNVKRVKKAKPLQTQNRQIATLAPQVPTLVPGRAA